MNMRLRVHLGRTQRLSKYLKPGALAQFRDSRIIAKSHVLTRRVDSITLPSETQNDSPTTQVEFLPDFPILTRGPQRFGRKKLVAAKTALSSLSPPSDSFIGVVNSNLLVH